MPKPQILATKISSTLGRGKIFLVCFELSIPGQKKMAMFHQHIKKAKILVVGNCGFTFPFSNGSITKEVLSKQSDVRSFNFTPARKMLKDKTFQTSQKLDKSRACNTVASNTYQLDEYIFIHYHRPIHIQSNTNSLFYVLHDHLCLRSLTGKKMKQMPTMQVIGTK